VTRHDRIPSQLRHLAPPTSADEVAEHRWARLWRQGIAEIDVDRVGCQILRDSIIAECRRQNGTGMAEKTDRHSQKTQNLLYGQKNSFSGEINGKGRK
jgi:hypothetical protein